MWFENKTFDQFVHHYTDDEGLEGVIIVSPGGRVYCDENNVALLDAVTTSQMFKQIEDN